MTLDEAHRILDTQKDGTRLHPVIKITEALWQTGDISSPLPKHARPFDPDGINEWMESSRMAQGKGTGESLSRDLSGDQSGIDQKDERNQ
jgi:hypothetical protein